MTAEIITIGDELLIGQVVNTNQAFIAEKLSGIGIAVRRMVSVGDATDLIAGALGEAWARADVVLVTGGLGPTHDDVTKKAVCEFFDTELECNPVVRRNVEHQLGAKGIPWSPAAEEQTMFPKIAEVFLNNRGTAAGMLFRRENRFCIVMPGVPYEMRDMMTETVVPFLRTVVRGETVCSRTIRTTGVSESRLSKSLGNLDELLRGAELAFLPSPFGVRMRVTVRSRDASVIETELNRIEEQITAVASKYIYSHGDEELETVLGRILTERKLTIAVAESCTGGLVTDLLTDVSGSSTYLDRGVIAYSNMSKTELLGVRAELIAQHGAVSKEVAQAMAEGIRSKAGTDIGLSTTGIAGPTGGTAEKPVGLVWIGYADEKESLALKFNFGNDRRRVKERTAAAAMELVRRRLLRID